MFPCSGLRGVRGSAWLRGSGAAARLCGEESSPPHAGCKSRFGGERRSIVHDVLVSACADRTDGATVDEVIL